MKLAVTFDFWDTLYPSVGREGGPGIPERRAAVIRDFLAERGREVTIEQARRAYDEADAAHARHWLGDELRQPTVGEALDCIALVLGTKLRTRERTELGRRLQLRDELGRLEPFDGVAELIRDLGRDRRLGIISDTWLTPGELARDMLRRHDLLDAFSATLFSDETGFLKPHSRPFQLACSALSTAPGETIHVGDSERRDVAGARRAGMKAVFLAWDRPHGDSAADRVVNTPAELLPAIRGLAS